MQTPTRPLLSEAFCAALNQRFEEAAIRRDMSNRHFNPSSVPHLVFETRHSRASGELRGRWQGRIGRATLLPQSPVRVRFEIRVRDSEEALDLINAAKWFLGDDVTNVQVVNYDVSDSAELRLPLGNRHLVRPPNLSFEYPEDYDPWNAESIRQEVFVPARSVRGSRSPFLALQASYYGQHQEPS